MKTAIAATVATILLLSGCSAKTEYIYSKKSPKPIHDEEEKPDEKQEAAPLSKEGFREARWGDPIERVKKYFPSASIQKDGSLGCKDKVGSYPCVLRFDFTKNRLASVTVVLTETFSSSSSCVVAFENLKGLLSEKYGESKGEDEKWESETFKKYSTNKGTAVSAGQLTLLAEWHTLDTQISLLCYRPKFTPEVVLFYQSKDFYPEIEEAQKKKAIDDL